MANVRYGIKGYGQLELNQVAFRRSGRIEAQCALDAKVFAKMPAENGMLLAVNNIDRVVTLADGNFPVALHYSTEHMYDERANALKDFKLEIGGFLPRMGYLGAGDKYTTNCLAYDNATYVAEDGKTADEVFEEAINAVAADNRLYAHACPETGAHLINNVATGAVAIVLGASTMPDGTFAVKFQAL